VPGLHVGSRGVQIVCISLLRSGRVAGGGSFRAVESGERGRGRGMMILSSVCYCSVTSSFVVGMDEQVI
jgi:hypothetical protein